MYDDKENILNSIIDKTYLNNYTIRLTNKANVLEALNRNQLGYNLVL
jgi:hypothetical protein